MRSGQKYSIPIVLLILSLIYFLNSPSEMNNDVTVKSEESQPWTQNLKKWLRGEAVSADVSSADTNQVQDLATIREELKQWIQTGADQLEKPTADANAVKLQIQADIAALNRTEIKYIQNIVLDGNQPVNKRIFSNYALSLLPPDLQLQVSEELVTAPLAVFENIKPHSAEEVFRGQELALRYMQIDRVAEIAQSGNNAALDSLKRMVETLTDSSLRSYAQRKLEQIPR